MFFETDRLTIHAYARLERVVQYQNRGPNTVQESQAFLDKALSCQKQKPRHNFEWCIEVKATRLHIGGCGLYRRPESPEQAMIGYVLHPDHWNRGLMTEVVMGLTNYGQTKLKIERWQTSCDRENVASRRVLAKTASG